MAPRPYWKGYLKLSLVSCPIALYPAIDASERLSFRQVNRVTGNRLRQQLVDSVTGEVVEPDEKRRGYEVGENQFLVVEDEELEEAREEARSRPHSVAPAASVPEREAEQPAPRRGASKEEFEAKAPVRSRRVTSFDPSAMLGTSFNEASRPSSRAATTTSFRPTVIASRAAAVFTDCANA